MPSSINEYHSLVPLDLSPQKSVQAFGYPSWVYKAFSTEEGYIYALRRIEGGIFLCFHRILANCDPGFRLANENDIRIIQRWKKVTSANVVTVHNAWTTTQFGDSCIFPRVRPCPEHTSLIAR